MAAKPEDARRVIAAAADVLAVARQCGLAVIHLKLSLSAHPRARQQGMTQPFWRAMHELAETDRLTPGRPSTVDGDNIQRFTRHRNHAYAQGDYVIDNKKRLDCFFGTDLHQLPQALAATTLCLMGITTNTCVLKAAFTAFKSRLSRGRFVGLRRQHVRGRPARPRPPERSAQPRLGAVKQSVPRNNFGDERHDRRLSARTLPLSA